MCVYFYWCWCGEGVEGDVEVLRSVWGGWRFWDDGCEGVGVFEFGWSVRGVAKVRGENRGEVGVKCENVVRWDWECDENVWFWGVCVWLWYVWWCGEVV